MRLVRRVYAALLALYPREFRDDVGDDLRRAFDAALTEAHRAGRRRIGRGLAEVTDLALNLPAAWWERWTSGEGSRGPTGRSMTKTSGSAMDGVVQDVRYAVRSIRSRPGFTAVVVLTLALGIGASAAVVGIVDGILLDPLPYPDADELVYMYESYREDQTKSVSYPNYLDWRERNRVFEDLAARTSWSFTLTGRGEAREVTARLMSANLLDVLGVAPVVGRGFTADEEARGERTVLLGGELWAAVFASDPSVVGRTVTLDGEPWTVVGVLPRGLEFPLGGADVFAPTTVMSEADRS
ncbi:MAG TPA: ABC transporter permease, partial [Longimicrobiales bacterium]|nr:ABC transporter permease [Longimicrobiales bacterium]